MKRAQDIGLIFVILFLGTACKKASVHKDDLERAFLIRVEKGSALTNGMFDFMVVFESPEKEYVLSFLQGERACRIDASDYAAHQIPDSAYAVWSIHLEGGHQDIYFLMGSDCPKLFKRNLHTSREELFVELLPVIFGYWQEEQNEALWYTIGPTHIYNEKYPQGRPYVIDTAGYLWILDEQHQASRFRLHEVGATRLTLSDTAGTYYHFERISARKSVLS
ncbi:hypothetical protein A3SI_07009 [Nitritalea halalkaliphila LW7]|uniref:Lipoprotein n=1 Tax=Nitritalea halalkaliphila LW7 TaxID=1189621 RepID=I5C5F2_9BACT|nr:hypothetical protein [Nitritalea halalkaliphila]EIM77054.1 hypothetical protein A3SI_07009 [Nitritalea halalkaliphila LW7]